MTRVNRLIVATAFAAGGVWVAAPSVVAQPVAAPAPVQAQETGVVDQVATETFSLSQSELTSLAAIGAGAPGSDWGTVHVEPAPDTTGTPDPSANSRVQDGFDALREDPNLYDPGLVDRDTLTTPPADLAPGEPDPNLVDPGPIQDNPSLPAPDPRTELDGIDPSLVESVAGIAPAGFESSLPADYGDDLGYGFDDENAAEPDYGDYGSGYDDGYGSDYDGGYDPGYDSGGYDSGGYDSGGYDSGGYDSGGYDSGGYDSGGYDSGGYDSGGYDSGGYDSGGYDSGGGYGY